jgi:hypothetical protein
MISKTLPLAGFFLMNCHIFGKKLSKHETHTFYFFARVSLPQHSGFHLQNLVKQISPKQQD